MLKCCIKPLVTLVLTLVAVGVLSTLCPARELGSPAGSMAFSATGSVKPKPVALSGEPDMPQCTPPQRLSGRISAPQTREASTGGSFVGALRWISLIWASWFARAAL